MIQSTFTLSDVRGFPMSAQKFTAVIAIKSLFLDVMRPGSNQLKSVVLGEKILYKKNISVYLVTASSNLLDSTQHIRYSTLVWFDQTPGL